MDIWIYNPNSTGGNYEYAKQLERVYNRSDLFQCQLILPSNAESSDHGIRLLLPDSSKSKNLLIRKLYFLKRTFINPIRFYRFLKKQQDERGVVLFNDFDQLSVPIWAAWLKRLKKRFLFGTMLHDPDRSDYPPHPAYSSYCMHRMLGLMDFVMYHDYLPELSYYTSYKGLKISVPHGLYPLVEPDQLLLEQLIAWQHEVYTLGIVGNIREEKNYELAIRALLMLPDSKLIIAGNPANSSVDVERYKQLAKQLKVSDRIYWFITYLTDAQLSTVIQVIDLHLLYYKQSFTSQSGVVNLLASVKGNVLISKTESGLAKLAEKFGFGVLAKPDHLESLIEGIEEARNKINIEMDWVEYLKYADWNQHVNSMEYVINKLGYHEALAG